MAELTTASISANRLSLGCLRQPNLLVADVVGKLHVSASPIGRQNALVDIPMDTAVRPIHRALHIPMLDRVVMGVIDMSCIIPFVANAMFPKSRLPNRLFLFMPSPRGHGRAIFCFDLLGQCTLDIAPPDRIIRIPRRQALNGVDVIRQNHDGVDVKRPPLHLRPECHPQLGDPCRIVKYRPA